MQWLWRMIGPGGGEGWERLEQEDGTVKEGDWRRGGRWGVKLFSGMADDEDTLEERRRLLDRL